MRGILFVLFDMRNGLSFYDVDCSRRMGNKIRCQVEDMEEALVCVD